MQIPVVSEETIEGILIQYGEHGNHQWGERLCLANKELEEHNPHLNQFLQEHIINKYHPIIHGAMAEVVWATLVAIGAQMEVDKLSLMKVGAENE